MNLWRVLILSPLLLLGGCLVTFDKPIEPAQAAPLPLLGEWSGEDEWGEQRFLDITQLGGNRYRAVSTSGSPDNAEGREEIDFTVAQHGRRWYLCASVPAQYGADYAIAGFELTRKNELILYSLDVPHILAALDSGALQGRAVELPEGDGARVESPLQQVFAYLDDPANAGVFSEAARYRRVLD